MRTVIEQFFSSLKTTLALLLLYAFVLAIATFVEKHCGTNMAKVLIYYSPVSFLLQLLLVINFVFACIKHRYLKKHRWGLMAIHSAFIVILAGAFVSHVFGVEGVLHLREGENSDRIMMKTTDKTDYHTLPFSVELIKFALTRYPGSSSPSSYESELLIHVDGLSRHERVYMNNVLDVKGYRFFQASYDKDEHGTILSVNCDVAGRNITYAGYLLLFVGLVGSFIDKKSRFTQLRKDLKSLGSKSLPLLLLVASSFTAYAADDPKVLLDAIRHHKVDAAHAARLGALPIQANNGRIIPVNTFSSEIMRKLCKTDKLEGLNSDQFLISLLAMPDMWMRIPCIVFSNEELAKFFDLSEGKCSYASLFDTNGNYKLQERLEEAYNRMPAERTRFDKDLLKLDEQANIFHQLLNHQLLNLFPKEDDPNHRWYAPGDDLSVFSGKDSLFVSRIMTWYLSEVGESLKSKDWRKSDEVLSMISIYQQAKNKTLYVSEKKLRAEVRYNRLNIFNQCKKGYLIAGGILLVLSFALLFERKRWMTIVSRALCAVVLLVFCCHIYGMGIRWYIAGYAPWSNSYETMVYVAWATVLAGILFMGRSLVTFALATLFGGIILFVSGLSWMDPQINTLVPVLNSPWLMFHVAVIVAAYGFFGICCLIGLTNLALMSVARRKSSDLFSLRIKELSVINEMAMLLGLALMTIGTFLGAVWANESWGRYWGWDPKETWALITMLVYAVVAHMHTVKRLNDVWLFNLCSIAAFSTVLMTFFGVNYFLSGMHSYGQNDNVHGIFNYLYLASGIVVVLAFVSARSWNKMNRSIDL